MDHYIDNTRISMGMLLFQVELYLEIEGLKIDGLTEIEIVGFIAYHTRKIWPDAVDMW